MWKLVLVGIVPAIFAYLMVILLKKMNFLEKAQAELELICRPRYLYKVKLDLLITLSKIILQMLQKSHNLE